MSMRTCRLWTSVVAIGLACACAPFISTKSDAAETGDADGKDNLLIAYLEAEANEPIDIVFVDKEGRRHPYEKATARVPEPFRGPAVATSKGAIAFRCKVFLDYRLDVPDGKGGRISLKNFPQWESLLNKYLAEGARAEFDYLQEQYILWLKTTVEHGGAIDMTLLSAHWRRNCASIPGLEMVGLML